MSSEILDGPLDPDTPQNLTGMVEESERYLRSIDELLIPRGMKRNEILKEKEIHVVRLENVVDSLLQNFLVRPLHPGILSDETYAGDGIDRTNQTKHLARVWIWPANFSVVAQSWHSSTLTSIDSWQDVQHKKHWRLHDLER